MVLVGAWTAFAVLAVVVALHGSAPFGWEQQTVQWAGGHRPGAARTTARAVTSLGTAAVPWAAALAAGLLVARRAPADRRLLLAVTPLLWLLAGQLLRTLLMHGIGRPRPPAAGWAVPASGFSFPSGHTFTSATAFGLLAWALGRDLAIRGYGRTFRRRCTAALAALAVLVGLSRVYLSVHWPLDVLGGWLLAAGWLALGALLLIRRRPRPRTAEPERIRAP
ncbi:phosphatase PAP2 family protein [Kitasatospora sp. KL5]|uniref:phosphatase PAP2 family protein n=1 Tax=Kitasatospora sp. KL5 TaxID=3425125 RepID=UPI003D6F1BDE